MEPGLMSRANKKGNGVGWLLWLIVGLSALALVIWRILAGREVALLNPQGLIADQQHGLLVLVIALLLLATVPVVLLLYFTAWKYRESNPKTLHHPSSRQGKFFEFTIWAFPISVFVVFMCIMVPATHKLEPRKAIAAEAEPLTIQVIAMRWKWLFLYPEQKVASVNFVQIPKNTPVVFELTADDTPMSSFWIPNLGGQLYAMTGHVNRLNLLATKSGEYRGSTAEINGAGFADMLFTARVGSQVDFDTWVETTKQEGKLLDTAGYEKLLKPSEHNPATFYGSYQNNLYNTVITKYMGAHNHARSEGGAHE